MAIVVDCPSCTRVLRVPDEMLGRKVKCPRCGETFTANDQGELKREVDEETPPKKSSNIRERLSDLEKKPARRTDEDGFDEEDQKPRQRSRAGDDEVYRSSSRKRAPADWRQVLRGLTMIMIAVLFWIIAPTIQLIGLLVVGGVVLSSFGPSMNSGGRVPPSTGGMAAGAVGMIILTVVIKLLNLGAWILKIIGHIFCLPSPVKYGSRTLAMITLGVMGAAAAFWLLQEAVNIVEVGLILSAPGSYPGGLGLVVALVTSVLWIGGFFVFLFYLRSVAQAVGADGLARQVVWYMISVGGSVVLSVISVCLTAVLMGVGMSASASQKSGPNVGGLAAAGALGLICMVSLALLFLGLVIWYIVLIILTRSAVGSYVRRKGY